MGIFSKKKRSKNTAFMVVNNQQWQDMICNGYTSLENNPEVITAVEQIAQLIASMTIYLMENTDRGDIRIKNGLSRIIDITPNDYQNRTNFIFWITKTMLLKGNAVVMPKTQDGKLQSLDPVRPESVSIESNLTGEGYNIQINGVTYDPKELLHFALNPGANEPYRGMGYSVALKNVINNLAQAQKTINGFLSSKWAPSLIVKVDAMTEEFSSPGGRRKLLDNYVKTNERGEPWILPADAVQVEQVRPLTLADLAINDSVKLDKQTVAAIIGVPAFVLGVGEFKAAEWNNFISSRVKYFASVIEQELTRKLLLNPKFYFKFNARSLYRYDMTELATVANAEFTRGIMTGNEVRDWLGLSPLEGLDDLKILENFINLDRIDDQSKLMGGNK